MLSLAIDGSIEASDLPIKMTQQVGLIIALMVIVAISYRQTIKANPQPDWWQ